MITSPCLTLYLGTLYLDSPRYNAMIAPLLNLTIKGAISRVSPRSSRRISPCISPHLPLVITGAIWYQGEFNCGHAQVRPPSLPAPYHPPNPMRS